MRTRFQLSLDELREKLLRMGGLAEQAVDRACQAYRDRDLSRCQLVLENESLINAAEREIDERAFDLLARAAGDKEAKLILPFQLRGQPRSALFDVRDLAHSQKSRDQLLAFRKRR